MRKSKYIRMSKMQIMDFILTCKKMSESWESPIEIIRQFNYLTPTQRIEVTNEFKKYEARLKENIEAGNKDMYLTCSMVNLNIVASKYNIDPATVCLCISPPCKSNQKLLIG